MLATLPFLLLGLLLVAGVPSGTRGPIHARPVWDAQPPHSSSPSAPQASGASAVCPRHHSAARGPDGARSHEAQEGYSEGCV